MGGGVEPLKPPLCVRPWSDNGVMDNVRDRTYVRFVLSVDECQKTTREELAV